jgi:DNA polymerase-3 subunit gamma/tau
LIDYWRDLMLVAAAGPEFDGLHASRELRTALREQVAKATLDTVLAGLDVLHSARVQLRNSSRGRVLVEMALIRLSRLDGLISLSQIAQLLQGGVELPAAPAPAARAIAAPEQKKNSPELTPPAAATPATSPTGLTADTMAQIWPEILAQIGPMLAQNVNVAGMPAIFGPNVLVLQFPPEYNHQRAYCTDETRLKRVVDALKRVTGQDWVVRVEAALHRNGQPRPVMPVASTPAAGPPALDHALLKKAEDVLGAKLMAVDDGFGAVAESEPDEG